MKDKKIKLATLGAIFLFVLVVGAAFAFYSLDHVSDFGTKTATARAGGMGRIVLNGLSADLTLSLDALDMEASNANTYYASSEGKTTTPTEVTLGVASVSPNTDTNYYNCEYILEVTHTGDNDLYDLFNHKTNDEYDYANRSVGQIILTINGVDYDFTGEWPSEVTGTFSISGTNTHEVTAGLRFINSSTIDQTYLENADIAINISVKSNSLKCSLYEPVTFASVIDEEIENGLMIEYMGEGNYSDTEHPFFTNHIYHWWVPNTTYNGKSATENAAIVKDKWNVVFGGFCWQMIRTTESGGVKLLYNGEPVLGTDAETGEPTYDCSETGSRLNNHVGINGQRGTQTGFSNSTSFIYGDSYSLNGTTATIEDSSGSVITSTWDETKAANLIGKYTCKNNTGTCSITSMYLIDGYNDATSAYTFTMSNAIQYNMIGNSKFNSSYNSPAYVGYMYNDNTELISKALSSGTNYKLSNSISYSDITGKYTLDMTDGNALDETDWSTTANKNKIGKAHYICIDSSDNLLVNTTECEKVGYIYYVSSNTASFMPLSGGQYISTDTSSTSGMTKWADEKNLLYKMLYIDNVNSKDSNIKQQIDAWYRLNLYNTSYERYIDEDEIYCGDRSTSNNFGSWNLNSANMTTDLYFLGLGYQSGKTINGVSNQTVYNLSCPNENDAYSKGTSNRGNGDLIYPIGLMSYPEMYNLGAKAIRTYTNRNVQLSWLSSPRPFSTRAAVSYTHYSGALDGGSVHSLVGSRPSISLKPTAEISSDGDGSTTNPYVVITN